MKRILMLFAMLAMLVSGISFSQTAFADDKAAKPHAACKTECNTCAKVCEKTLAYCLKKGGKHAEAAHLNLIRDCITTCKASDEFMGRDSALMAKACALCKEACLKCAESCETFKGDKVMKDCADECRKCAASCDTMDG